MDIDKNTFKAVLKFISGETEYVCRLCFSSTATGAVFMDDHFVLQANFIDETVKYQHMLDALNISSLNELPLTLCLQCSDNIRNAYTLQKLSQYSQSMWLQCLDIVSDMVGLCDNVKYKPKTVYLISKGQQTNILTLNKEVPKCKKKVLANLMHLENKKLTCKKKIEQNLVIPTATDYHDLNEKFNKKDLGATFPCKYCFKVFTGSYKIKYHYEKAHAPKTVMCSQCPQMFGSERIYQRHIITHHETVRCKKCHEKFPSQNELKKHQIKHLPPTVQCQHCHKTFKNGAYFNKHVKMCGLDALKRSVKCDICQKEFTSKRSLRIHLIAFHGFGEPIICKWCGKKYGSKAHYNDHVVKHTKVKSFSCEKCGGQFVTAASLRYHLRIHTGEKPVTCEICGSSFLNASRKMDHVRRQHLKITKPCPICHRKFNEGALTRHQKRHFNPNSSLYVGELDGVIVDKFTVEVKKQYDFNEAAIHKK